MKLQEQEGVRSVGLILIGWSVLLSNILLLAFQYYLPLVHQKVFFPRIVSFVSMTAVFPQDFYFTYLDEVWYAHFGWIFTMIICALGILRINKMSRMIFIVLNVVHSVILLNIVLFRFGQPVFLQYFFKLYFNLVAVLTYVGFITTGEMRILFEVDEEESFLNKIFQKAHIKTPVLTDAKGYYNLALAYSRLERYEDAIATLKKAMTITPEDPKLYFQLGIIYLNRDEFAGAINSFKETIHLDPIFPEVYYYVGMAYRQQGCDKEAIPYLERALKINPNLEGIPAVLAEAKKHD
jgi:tetratricopeptide (TPR) repeat protein